MQKYFEILDLDMSASIEEVEQAYKELTQAWRPQSYQNLPRFKRKAEIKLKEIDEAHERVRSYLLAKQAADHNGEPLAVAEKLPESREESRPDRKTPRLQFRKPNNRNLLYGFIAVAAVLGALLLYQVANHPEHRQAAPEQEKPAPQAASPQASADHPQKESESTTTRTAGGLDFTAKGGKRQGREAPPSLRAEPGAKHPVWKAQSGPAGAPIAAKTPPAVKSAEPATLAPASMDKGKKPLKKRAAHAAPLEHSVLDRVNQDPDRVKRIQKGLIANGYDTGPPDGIIGPQTIAALKQFAGDRAIKADRLFADDLTGAVLVYAEIAATHPDAPKIIRSNDFALWLDSQTHFQTSAIQKLKKYPTARQVIEILDRYKSDKKK